MDRTDTDQDLVHAGCGEGAVDVPSPAPQTLDLDTPDGHTASQQHSVSRPDVAVDEQSTALAAPGRELQPWVAEPLSAGVDNALVAKPAAGDATSRLTSTRVCLGSESAFHDGGTEVATGQEEMSARAEASDAPTSRIAFFDAAHEDGDSHVAPSTNAAADVKGTGLMFDAPRDGGIAANNSDSTTHGDSTPYYVDLCVDDKEEIIPPEERSFRGKLDTGSQYNILTASTAARMQLIDRMDPVDEDFRIQGISISPVPACGRLKMTVHVGYESIEFHCRTVWHVVDDRYTGGSFDALVGLPVIRKSERLGVIVFANWAFGDTSVGASSVGYSDSQIEIEDDNQEPSATMAPAG